MNETKTHWEGCWEADTHGECARIHARALAAKLTAAERDAERLDYLQNMTDENGECWLQHVRTHDGFPVYQICTSYDEGEPDRYTDIRTAIDAARGVKS